MKRAALPAVLSRALAPQPKRVRACATPARPTRSEGGPHTAVSRAELRLLRGKACCACAAAALACSITWWSQNGSVLLDLPRSAVAKAPRSSSGGGRSPAERPRRARVCEWRERDAHGTGNVTVPGWGCWLPPRCAAPGGVGEWPRGTRSRPQHKSQGASRRWELFAGSGARGSCAALLSGFPVSLVLCLFCGQGFIPLPLPLPFNLVCCGSQNPQSDQGLICDQVYFVGVFRSVCAFD